MRVRRLIFTLAFAAAAALPAAADDSSYTDKARSVADTAKDSGTRVTGKDALFVRKAAIGGMAEVKSAELAKSKASSAEVKSLADRMVQDHTKANQELEALAKQKGFTVPNALDNEHKAKLDELSGLSGEAFDKAYLKQQKMGHEKMLQVIKDEATNGKDPDLKSFAAKTKKVVAEHHARIQKISGHGGAHASSS